MKKLLFTLGVAAAGIAMTSCSSGVKAPKDYTVEGTIEGLKDSTKVYLSSPIEHEIVPFDSVYAIGGQFKLGGNLDNPKMVYLNTEGNRTMSPIFVAKDIHAQVIGQLDGETPYQITAGADQEVFTSYEKKNRQLNLEMKKLYSEYTAAKAADDTAKVEEIEATYERLMEKGDELLAETVKANPASIVAPFLIYPSSYKFSLEELEALVSPLTGNAVKTPIYKQLDEKIKTLKAVEPGKTAPDFTLNNAEGNPISLSDLKGDVILLDFWASWCGPCRKENPNVVAIYNDFKDQGLKIIGVSLDTDRQKWLDAIEADGITWAQVSTLDNKNRPAADLYGVTAIPHIILIDKDFKIVDKNLHGDELREAVAKQFEKK